MAMSQSVFRMALGRSPAASPSPFAGRFLSGPPLASAYRTSAARRLPRPGTSPPCAATRRPFLARSGFPPAMGVRAYVSSSGSGRRLSTKEGIKDKVADYPKQSKLIRWFLRKIGHPSAFTGQELREWGRNHKGWKDTHPTSPMFAVLTGVCVIFWVHADWKDIKASFVEFVGGLKTGGRAQDKD